MTGGQRVKLKRVKHRLNARQSLRVQQRFRKAWSLSQRHALPNNHHGTLFRTTLLFDTSILGQRLAHRIEKRLAINGSEET